MNEWGIQTTNELIHALYESNVQVLFASNLSPKDMKRKFLDIRSQSRLAEMCGQFVFKMQGYDRRGNVEEFFQ
jgi:DNA replication protein DnaC